MFGGDWEGQPSEMFTVGEDSSWTDLGKIAGRYPTAISFNNEVYFKGMPDYFDLIEIFYHFFRLSIFNN